MVMLRGPLDLVPYVGASRRTMLLLPALALLIILYCVYRLRNGRSIRRQLRRLFRKFS
jgi:hypothetical protein